MQKKSLKNGSSIDLSDLQSFKLLDTLLPDEFDKAAELAAFVIGTTAENVSLVGRDPIAFRYKKGAQSQAIPTLPPLFCDFSNEEDLVIQDMHPAVRNASDSRFFLRVLLRNKNTHPFAALCITDDKPHQLQNAPLQALQTIASQLTAIMESRRDLIEAERASHTAEHSISVLKQVLDSSVDAVTISDLTQPNQPLIYVNKAFETLTGYSPFEVLGRNCRFLQGKDTQQPILKIVRSAIERKTKFRGVIRNYRKDGTPFWNELSLFPIQDESGQVKYMLGEQRNRRSASDQSSPQPADDIKASDNFEGLIGNSATMAELRNQIESVARVDAPVLIEGETGTGKELVAKAIHQTSPRAKYPFIAMNCAGIAESLLTSQLFGHKRGSFTGAIDNSQGVFEAAQNGTLFLDEIGDMPAGLQMALLRVLQEKEITRVGETSPRKINVRVIAATHRDMAGLVSEKKFREDLLFRIRVARIKTPSLRDHIDDISALVKHFIRELNAANRRQINDISSQAKSALSAYRWPGNVRELRSAIEYAFIQCQGSTIELFDLPPEITTPNHPDRKLGAQSSSKEAQIEEALRQTGGNRNEAAKLLGMSRATFFRYLAKTRTR